MSSQAFQGIIQAVFVNKPDFSIGILKVAGEGQPPITFLAKYNSFVGEEVKLIGDFDHHTQYGTRFVVTSVTKILPSDPKKLETLLSSGMIKGVGKVTAKNMIEMWGGKIRDVLDGGRVLDLIAVSGVGNATAYKILDGWNDYRVNAQTLSFLLNAGFNLALAKTVIRKFGSTDVELILRKNPYNIVLVPGVGWKRADVFANRLGINTDDPRRIEAAVMYSLLNISYGHTYMPHDLLRADVTTLTGVDLNNGTLFIDAITKLVKEKKVVDTPEGLYHNIMFFDERTIATGLVDLDLGISDKQRVDDDDLVKLIAKYEGKTKVKLSDGQHKAIGLAVNRGVSIITGGPGVGKTLAIGGVIDVAKSLGLRFALAAPTGRAAKRITESTGYQAKTLHRLLEFQPHNSAFVGMFARNDDNPLDIDILIADELSMADTTIMAALVRALKPGTRLVMVGDVDQLESVGSGKILTDTIASNMFYITHLNQIFRQAAKSKIIVNAQQINSGQPFINGQKGDDFFWIEDPTIGRIKRLINRIRVVDPKVKMEDIQIITPFRKKITDINITSLNEVMQDMINKKGEPIPIPHCELRVGDKVLQTKNNYEKGVFNGDIGFVTDIVPDYSGMEGYFNVSVDGKSVPYHFREHGQLELAYAITVHKSQGGEYPYVIVVLSPDRKADIMLRRNLLYTAVTRASKMCLVLARDREVKLAVKTERTVVRFTGLLEKLRELRFKKRDKESKTKAEDKHE